MNVKKETPGGHRAAPRAVCPGRWHLGGEWKPEHMLS